MDCNPQICQQRIKRRQFFFFLRSTTYLAASLFGGDYVNLMFIFVLIFIQMGLTKYRGSCLFLKTGLF